MKAILVFIVFLSFHAFADGSVLSCNNGDISEVGDRLFQVEVTESEIVVNPYESGFKLPLSKVSQQILSDGATLFYASNVAVIYSSEGEEYHQLLTFMVLHLNKDRTQASITYSFFDEDGWAQELSCK
jgi:hypothetical protein